MDGLDISFLQDLYRICSRENRGPYLLAWHACFVHGRFDTSRSRFVTHIKSIRYKQKSWAVAGVRQDEALGSHGLHEHAPRGWQPRAACDPVSADVH